MGWFGAFSFGRYPWWNLKVPDVGLLLWVFLGEVRISEFCLCCWVLLCWRAHGLGLGSCTGGCGRWHFWLGLFAMAFGSWRLWGWFCRFYGASGPQLFEGVCFCCPLVYGFFIVWWFLGVVKKQTISSLNDLSIVFESPSSVKHCKVGTLHGGRGSCHQEPLGIMGWPSGCHIMMSCVCWGVAPAGLHLVGGYLATRAPI